MPETRPFRDLCPEADARDAMDDGEFWEHVAVNIAGPQVVAIEDFVSLDEVSNQDTPCAVCGGYGACLYDSEGRALIHVANDPDEDSLAAASDGRSDERN